MTSAEIVANAQADVTQAKQFESQVIAMIEGLISKNVAPVLAIKDDAQLMEVIEQLIIIVANQYVPFWIRPVESFAVGKFVEWAFALLSKKFPGKDLLTLIQDIARSVEGQTNG